MTVISNFCALGYLAAGDANGNLVIWHSSILSQIKVVEVAHESFRIQLDKEYITAIAMNDYAIFVGTKSGMVYVSHGIEDKNFVELAVIYKLAGDLGAVSHLMLAPFWRNGCGMLNIVALYVYAANLQYFVEIL